MPSSTSLSLLCVCDCTSHPGQTEGGVRWCMVALFRQPNLHSTVQFEKFFYFFDLPERFQSFVLVECLFSVQQQGHMG